MTEIHITAIRNGDVWGHETKHCDPAGCAAGADGYWRNVLEGNVGDIVEVIEIRGKTYTKSQYEALVNLMDDDIRERLHAKLAPCDESEFAEAYAAEMKKRGEEWPPREF